MIVSPPFVADTRAPGEKLPAGACDCHMHVYGDPSKYPYRNPHPRISAGATYEASQKLHAALGFARMVIVQPSAYVTDPSLLIDTLRAAPRDRYRGVAIIDDSINDATLQTLHVVGVRAARFNFWKALGVVPEVGMFFRSIERIKSMGWHIKIFASADDLIELRPVLEKVTVNAVLDHMAHLEFRGGVSQPACQVALELLKRENWWMLLSNGDRGSAGETPWKDAVPFGRLMYETAPDRCIWGSDWPHLAYEKRMPNDAELVELLYSYLPDEAARKSVLVDNPAKLYGFA
jgi:predicted TIM-barrel fold metal-dependent hydrolase